ncbi:MAG: hypothetical protein R3F53_08715 [Gammaproteobacteria bacterium]|nr:hypothetical protein [Candidatus Competibacteraceae bacterium]
MKFFYSSLLGLLLCLGPSALWAQNAADIAADMARAETGGRVLSVQPSRQPNRPGFEVKILLPNGTVQIRFYNPQ